MPRFKVSGMGKIITLAQNEEKNKVAVGCGDGEERIIGENETENLSIVHH